MTKGVAINKHIKIEYSKRGNTSHIILNGIRYNYVSIYLSADAAYEVANREFPGLEWVIIPLGGYGNPSIPGLFVAEE